MARIPPNTEEYRIRCEELGYKFFTGDKAPYNLNIVGWRNSVISLNKFNDYIAVYFAGKHGTWHEYFWRATTLPGNAPLLSPINNKGTAILVPGQYIGSYALGKYRGYTALRQVAPVCVYRDNNRDLTHDLDINSKDKGNFGIHIHRAGMFSFLVDNWSAGCQVFQSKESFEFFIYICRRASNFWGNRFTYTLMEF